jgi:sensor domain CHASE-containing protein
MALRLKILGVISIALVGLFAILYVTSQVILGSSFAALEDQDTRQNLERARDALLAELLALHTKSADWANWDDTYAFIEDANPDYIESNLVDKAFVDLRLNLMLFIAPSGKLVFTKAFDLQNEKEIALPPSLAPHLSSDSPLLKQPDPNRGLTGIVLLAEGPLLISSRPILTSEGNGPSRGTLIFGRYLDDASLQRLAGTTHLSIAARRFDDAQMPPDFQSAKAVLSETTPRFVQPSSQSSIMGYGLLQDVYSKPALLLRVELPRDIYQQGQATIRYLMLWVIAIGLVFGAVAQFTMDRLVSAWQERARLFAEEQTRREELGALYTLSRAVAETVDFDVILNLVTRRAVETIRCTFARVHLIEDSALVLRAAYPVRVLNRDLQIGRRDRIGEFPYCQRILQQDAPVLFRADSPEIDDYERSEERRVGKECRRLCRSRWSPYH